MGAAMQSSMAGKTSNQTLDNKTYMSVSADDKRRGPAEAVLAAASWLADADAVLVCAGAGLSLNDGYNVYVSNRDFARHYPHFPKWGYRTAYECMGLFGDRRVPPEAKWGFWGHHMENMRWKFPVHAGYELLFEMLAEKDHFVYTSNVDGCFERCGFDVERIYTPQGDWQYYQCMGKTGREGPCSPNSYFQSRAMLDVLLPYVRDGVVPSGNLPKCLNCGGEVFGNVRGGGWFLHTPYDQANERFVAWVEGCLASKKRLVVLEVGCGFNTPTVTRFPMEAIVREAEGHGGALIRVNPGEPETPPDLTRSVGLHSGWEVLGDLKQLMEDEEPEVLRGAEGRVCSGRAAMAEKARQSGVFKRQHWRSMMRELRGRA